MESIKQTLLHGLLKSGENIINKGHFVENKCPLCLQSKNIEGLKDELQERLKKVESSLEEKKRFDSIRESFWKIIDGQLEQHKGIGVLKIK
jgi:hypothetical protein